jgi:hypothetical protein
MKELGEDQQKQKTRGRINRTRHKRKGGLETGMAQSFSGIDLEMGNGEM